jgi:putative transposase
MGVFDCILSGLAACEEEPDIVMIDATHLKAHRTACSLVKKGQLHDELAERKAA